MKIQTITTYNNVVPFRANTSVIQKAVYTSRKLDNCGYHRGDDRIYFDFLNGEIDEFKDAVKNNDKDNMEEEIGDVLFDAVMLADHYGINPEKALKRTTKKIEDRIFVASMLADKPLVEYSVDERLEYWKKAKEELAKQG